MAESYLEKRKRILKEQKKRFEAKKITGGAGDANTFPKKKPPSSITIIINSMVTISVGGYNLRFIPKIPL